MRFWLTWRRRPVRLRSRQSRGSIFVVRMRSLTKGWLGEGVDQRRHSSQPGFGTCFELVPGATLWWLSRGVLVSSRNSLQSRIRSRVGRYRADIGTFFGGRERSLWCGPTTRPKVSLAASLLSIANEEVLGLHHLVFNDSCVSSSVQPLPLGFLSNYNSSSSIPSHRPSNLGGSFSCSCRYDNWNGDDCVLSLLQRPFL